MEVITLEPDSRQYVQNINTQISLACIFKELKKKTYNESYDIKTVFYEIYQEYRTRISS